MIGSNNMNNKNRELLIRIAIISASLLGVLILFAIGSSIFRSLKKAEAQAYKVGVIKLEKKKIEQVINLQGITEGDPQVKIYPSVPGKLARLAVKEGDMVRVDEPIMYLNRDQEGYEYRLAPVKSSINGVVTKIYYIDRGSSLSPDMPVAEVSNNDNIKVIINTGEDELLAFREGQKVLIIPIHKKEIKLEGVIHSVSPFVDSDLLTGTVVIKASNRDKSILAGMTVDINVFIGSFEGFMVPESAVLMKKGNIYVFVNVNGIAKMVPVEKGYLKDGMMQIIGKINNGDEIVKEGNFKLYDGAKIIVVK